VVKLPEDLSDIWEDQKKFNSNFVDYNDLSDEEKIIKTKEYTLLMIDELMEMLRETSWKTHRKNTSDFILSNFKEEYIDVFKYFISIGLLWDVNPEKLFEEYKRKSEVVEQRYKQEKQLEFDGKIAGIDIDGVLADYPHYFLKYVRKYAKTDLKVEDLNDYNLYQELGLPIELTKQLKHDFRQSGQLANVPLISGAKEMLDGLKNNGYSVVLLSSRPYKQYKRIFADTKEWLNKNDLYHDVIIWGEDKCSKLIREFGKDNVEFFVEDNLDNANDIARISKVYLYNMPYNQEETKENVIRINNLIEIEEAK